MTFKTFTIGRSEVSNIVVDDETVSRNHAEISFVNNSRYYVIDCDSTWGTFVLRNNEWQQFTHSYVELGDYIAFGKYRVLMKDLVSGLSAPVKQKNNYEAEPLSVKPKRNVLTGEVEV
ncbi:MAG: FHA domain-containing protein [Gammaproteobacteria bacterium]|nr:FHA domain-containing protein [Gammaproteobacteria bacterium]